MKLFQGVEAVPDTFRGSALAIGNFDGVHRGHQSVLRSTRAIAAEEGTKSGVMVFEPHPRTFFKPSEPVFRLTPLALKSQLFAALGLDMAVVLEFNADLAALPAQAFVERILVEGLGVRHVITGTNFKFGKGAAGDTGLLSSLGEVLGFRATAIEPVETGEMPISSSRVRAALRAGDLTMATSLLGYRWRIIGQVERGAGRGTSLGFPTANIALDPGQTPRQGVYAVRVRVGGGLYDGAGYIGRRRTFGGGDVLLEVTLFDVEKDFYGEPIEVIFYGHVRDDRVFDTSEALIAQIKADCHDVRNILQNAPDDDESDGLIMERALNSSTAEVV